MNLIVAADRRWAIGRQGRPLVTIPADWQLLLKETAGKVVVMGRKTLEGLPGGQPLGNRTNVILSRDPGYKVKGTLVCTSLEEALEVLSDFDPEDVFILGGRSVYEQFLPYCATAHVTAIDYEYAADTHFKNLDQDPEWELTEESDEQTYFNLCYTFRKYKKMTKKF